jgi:hypothetical protein
MPRSDALEAVDVGGLDRLERLEELLAHAILDPHAVVHDVEANTVLPSTVPCARGSALG